MSEYASEPIRGLPGLLPKGERILWQGAPDWRGLARGPFLGDAVALYFLALMAWRFADGVAQGAPLGLLAIHTLWLGIVAAAGLTVIALLAWVQARATVYTITNRRVVMRIGAALTLSINAPFKRVASAALKRRSGGRADLSLVIGGGETFSWFMLWPHVRPWKMRRVEPAMRALAEPEKVARILGDALKAYEAEFGMDAALDEEPGRDATRPAPRPAGAMMPAE